MQVLRWKKATVLLGKSSKRAQEEVKTCPTCFILSATFIYTESECQITMQVCCIIWSCKDSGNFDKNSLGIHELYVWFNVVYNVLDEVYFLFVQGYEKKLNFTLP